MDHDLLHYNKLSSPSHFRLVYIKPEESSRDQIQSPVEVELCEVSLEDSPIYEAVSYAWEGQQATEQIICNGKALYVTSNVE